MKAFVHYAGQPAHDAMIRNKRQRKRATLDSMPGATPTVYQLRDPSGDWVRLWRNARGQSPEYFIVQHGRIVAVTVTGRWKESVRNKTFAPRLRRAVLPRGGA